MATVNGTSGNDFIHVAGDGLVPPGGYTDNAGATSGADTINSGVGGSDIIFAGGGDDTINFADDLDATDKITGGDGNDTLVINGQTFITFASDSLTSVENILLPFVQLQVGFAGLQHLTMNDGNVAAGQTMNINAAGIGSHTRLVFDGSAETDGRFNVTGGAGSDTITGGQAGNIFDMTQGGNDTVNGGAGYEDIYFGDTLTAADHVNIGGGDFIALSGPSYAAGLTFAPDTLTSSGSTILLDTSFSYKLIMDDANVAAGSVLHVQPNGLATTQTVFFDGSAEKDGRFDLQGFNGGDVLIGGRGDDSMDGHGGDDTIMTGRGTDTVFGEAGNDKIACGAQFDSLDHIDGGSESDTLTLNGDYSAGIVFSPTTLLNVERITLAAGNSYSLTTNNATVAAGATLTVVGTQLGAADQLIFDGSAETDGRFVITGGAGDDILTGGAGLDMITGGGGRDTLSGGLGPDRFVYPVAGDSTGIDHDVVKFADFKADKWNVPGTITAIDPEIATGHLSATVFDSDLATAADAAHLGAHHAVLFTPDKGGLAGKIYLVIDVNGVAGYQAGDDLVVQLSKPLNLASLDVHDFI